MAMNKPELYINIEDGDWLNALSNAEEISEVVAETTFKLAEKQHDLSFLDYKKPIIISLTLSSDAIVQQLNKEFRNIDKPTNVLSFANCDDVDFAKNCQLFEEIELGDIIIALQTMEREAKEKEITLQEHYCHLLTHGILHLLGLDHQNEDEAEYMENLEISILQQLDIPNPYTE